MLRACSALAALSAAAAVPGSGGSGWKLQMLHDAAEQDGAVCLDGTVSAQSSIVVSFTASETLLRCAGTGLLHPAGCRRGRQELQDSF